MCSKKHIFYRSFIKKISSAALFTYFFSKGKLDVGKVVVSKGEGPRSNGLGAMNDSTYLVTV